MHKSGHLRYCLMKRFAARVIPESLIPVRLPHLITGSLGGGMLEGKILYSGRGSQEQINEKRVFFVFRQSQSHLM